MLKPRRYSIFNSYPVVQALSTRPGGVSRPPLHYLNMGLRTGDDPEAVHENRRIFFDYLGLDGARAVRPSQVHGDYVHVAVEPGLITDCDALITRERGLTLTVQAADCATVYFYDPVRHACGVAHSGWRGTAKNIAVKTLQRMQRVFGSNPKNMITAIGAGISQRNYQVDAATAAYFDAAFLKKDGPTHYKLDVSGAIRRQLLQCGIREENLETDPLCTYDHSDLFYSYRRDGDQSGRMMGVLCLL